MEESIDKKLTDFDADFSSENPINEKAAKQRGLRYDSQREAYVDSEGCLIRDKYGQQL